MGYENDGYAHHDAVPYITEDGCAAGDGEVVAPSTREEVENRSGDGERAWVKPSKLLRTFAQRRTFITKSMDLHRHTIGGGRSGRRGRAECVAFLRYTLEVLDEMQEEAEGQLEIDPETDLPLGALGVARDEKGRFVGKQIEGDSDSSSSEEDASDDEEEEESDADDEQEEDDQVPLSAAKTPKGSARKASTPRGGSSSKATSAATITAATTTKGTKLPKKPNATRQPILSDADFFAQHNDLCEVCNSPGELLCCATCNLVFHTTCVRPKLAKEPSDDWKCAYCISAGVMGGKKDGRERRQATRGIREMEKARRDLLGGAALEDGDKKPAAAAVGDTAKSGAGGVEETPSADVLMEDSKPAAKGSKSADTKVEPMEVDDKKEIKTSPFPTSSSAATTTPTAPSTKTTAQPTKSEESKTKVSSRSSTPSRELEGVLGSVPKYLQTDEHDVMYSNTGRVQRARKKPIVFDPKMGVSDSDWKSDGEPTPGKEGVAAEGGSGDGGGGADDEDVGTTEEVAKVEVKTPMVKATPVAKTPASSASKQKSQKKTSKKKKGKKKKVRQCLHITCLVFIDWNDRVHFSLMSILSLSQSLSEKEWCYEDGKEETTSQKNNA